MPLHNSKSKKAFKENVETEMEHGKPQKQSLAIAFSVKRKAKKKKMAEGGVAYRNDSAITEQRPMPEERDNDSRMVSRNSGNKAPQPHDSFLNDDTSEQARRSGTWPLKHPKMVPTNAFSVKLRSDEDDLMQSASPGPYSEQPREDRNEQGPNRQGRRVPDMQKEHSTGRKPYAKGGSVFGERGVNRPEHERGIHSIVNVSDDPEAHEKSLAGTTARRGDNEKSKKAHKAVLSEMRAMPNPRLKGLAKGGKVQESDYDAAPNKYEDDLTDLPPSEDEGAQNARNRNEEGPDRQGPGISDNEEPHSEHDEMYDDNMEQAEDSMSRKMDDTVGMSAMDNDMDDQPEDEEELEHGASIAAAIMAKKRKMMARGGEILEDSPDIHSHGSMDTHEDEDQVDLSRNADEDANEEDQASFDALRKENYSESEGLRQMDSPEDSNEHSPEHEDMDLNDADIVSSIRRKMRIKSAITR